MVPWRLQKRFFQAGHSVNTTLAPIPSNKIKKKKRLPKKGKVPCPESVWRDVGNDVNDNMDDFGDGHDSEIVEQIKTEKEHKEEDGIENNRKDQKEIEDTEIKEKNDVDTDISPEGPCLHVHDEGEVKSYLHYVALQKSLITNRCVILLPIFCSLF